MIPSDGRPKKKGARSRHHRVSWFLIVMFLLTCNVSLAFTTVPLPTLSHHLQQQQQWRTGSGLCARRRSWCGPLFSSNSSGDGDNDEAVLTDLDARVLQSMLQDEKLNLQEEENMKRLLERGIKNSEPVAQEAKRAKKEAAQEDEYASQILKTLGNTKLWKGLSRNAADIFESAKIWVGNKVERDTKLVASLGFFAFERALQDVKRALPAASAAAQKVAPKFLLDTTTSANSNNNPDPKSSSSTDIRNRMTTPQDEIKSVTQEIKLIIQSGGERRGLGSGTGGILPSNARGLQSAATSKRGKDRFLKAYQRRKETTLRREKENLAQTSARLAGSVMDSAYQVRRELQVEPNQPGYKSKALREGAAQTSKLLASGAKGFLSGAKAVAQAALPATDKSTRGPRELPRSTASSQSSGGMDATAAAMDAAMGRVAPEKKKPTTPYIDATIVDAAVVDVRRQSVPRRPAPSRPQTAADAPINARIPGTSSSSPTSVPPTTSDTSYLYGAPPIPPDTTDSTTNAAEISDASEEDEFFFASREAPDFQQEQTVASLLSNKKKLDPMDDSSTDKSKFAYFTRVPAVEDEEISTSEEDVVEAAWEAQDRAFRAATSSASETSYDSSIYSDEDFLVEDDDDEEYYDEILLDDEDPQDTLRRVMAEIVSDEDFEYAVGQAKRVDNTASQEIEADEEDSEPSLLVVIALRLLDILFLVLEKVILAIPSLLSSIPRVASRYATIQSEGGGSEGWQTISKAQRGDKRY